MFNKTITSKLSPILALALLLSACGGASSGDALANESTLDTPLPTLVLSEVEGATSVPPSATPLPPTATELPPTVTPTATPTPSPTPFGGSGELLSFISNRDGNIEMYALDLVQAMQSGPDDAAHTNLTNSPNVDRNHYAWSPDGTQILIRSDRDGDFDIYVLGVECVRTGEACGEDAVQLTDHPAADGDAVWSPDGSQIAFQSNRDGGDFDIYVMDAACVSAPVEATRA